MLNGKNSPAFMENDPRLVPSAITLWGDDALREICREQIELNFGLWGTGQLSSEFKMFLFNFTQGKLYLNNVLARLDNTSPKCTFCELMAKRELEERGIGENAPEYAYYISLLPNESTGHLFWDCDHSQVVIQRVYRWIRGMDWYRGLETVQKNGFMMGTYSNLNKQLSKVDLVWKHFIKYFIYRCRISRKLPMFPSLKFELEGMHKMRNLIIQINNLYLL